MRITNRSLNLQFDARFGPIWVIEALHPLTSSWVPEPVRPLAPSAVRFEKFTGRKAERISAAHAEASA